MSEIEAGHLLVDLQEALDRESRGSSILLEGHALGGRAAFTAPSIAALEASTLRPEDYGQVQVQGAASPFKGDFHSFLAGKWALGFGGLLGWQRLLPSAPLLLYSSHVT